MSGQKYSAKTGFMFRASLTMGLTAVFWMLCLTWSCGLIWAQDGGNQEGNEMNYDFSARNEFGGKVKGLRTENKDVKGWIRIDGTMISYPLLQSADNSFYLKRDYNGEDSFYGSIFLNCRSDLRDDFSNLIIYGHNMKDKQMFGDLAKYANKSFYDEHPVIHITTEENESLYQIIHVFRSRVYGTEEGGFRYYSYVDLRDEETFYEYINECKAKELYDTGVTATFGDQLIALTTCEYTQTNGRFVVIAKKVGDVFDG